MVRWRASDRREEDISHRLTGGDRKNCTGNFGELSRGGKCEETAFTTLGALPSLSESQENLGLSAERKRTNKKTKHILGGKKHVRESLKDLQRGERIVKPRSWRIWESFFREGEKGAEKGGLFFERKDIVHWEKRCACRTLPIVQVIRRGGGGGKPLN